MAKDTKHDYMSLHCKCEGCAGARQAKGLRPRGKKRFAWYQKPSFIAWENSFPAGKAW